MEGNIVAQVIIFISFLISITLAIVIGSRTLRKPKNNH